MSSILEHATRRTSVVLLAVTLGLLLVVSPSPHATLSAGVLALTLAALVTFGRRGVPLASRVGLAVPLRADAAALLLPGRVTDPTHHPLRPRAPGTA